MPSSFFLPFLKWTVVTVISTSALLWASFHGLPQQPPPPTSDCPVAIAGSAHQTHVGPIRPQLGCDGWAVT